MTEHDPNQGIFQHIKHVYTASKKERDIFWNLYVARPLAAPLVLLFSKTPITPNQVTFLGALVFLVALAILVLWTGPWGFLVAALVMEVAYIFDCVDGQLARLTGQTSPVGAYLDFLIDEFKALGLVAAFAGRLCMEHPESQVLWLLIGMSGVVLVAIATSLTTFVRRPEYAGETIKHGVKAQKQRPTSLIGWVLRAVESTAQWVIHYPSWVVYLALINFIPQVPGTHIFLGMFLSVYMLYTAKTGLAIVLKLGHPRFAHKD